MLQNPFIWGQGGRKLTPDQVERERKLVEAARGRMGDTSPVGHWTQGATRVVDALGGVLRERRADKAEAAGMSGADDYIANNSVLAGLIGGGQSHQVQGGAQVMPASMPAGADAIRMGLIERGLPEHVADGFILNFQDESGLNPGINEANPIVPGSRGGFGLAQWTGPRRKALEQFAAQRGTPVSDTDTQLDFLMQELQGPEAGAAQSILGAQDTGSAAAAIVNKFLRPAEEHRARRAASYQGGSYAPQPQQDAGVIAALSGAMSDPWVAKKYGPVIESLMGNEMKRQNMAYGQQLQQSDPMYQAQLARLTAPEPVDPWAGTQVINGQIVRMGENGPEAIGDFNTPEAGPTSVQEYQFYAQQAQASGQKPLPYDQWDTSRKQAGATNISNVVGGDSSPGLGKLSADYGYVLNPDTGQPVIDRKTGLPTAAPVPGSPAAREIEAANQAVGIKDDNKAISSDIITSAAQNARALIGNMSTGIAGRVVGYNPQSDAAELSRQTEVLKSNAKIENLQAMRAASPTGGALGAVSDKESEMLAAKSGALDPTAGPDRFRQQLDDYERTLLRIVHGKDAGDAIFEQTRQPSEAGSDQPPPFLNEQDAELWDVYTPQEREAILQSYGGQRQ